MNFIDSAELQGVQVTDTGYLVADVFAVRTGIQQYLGAELGRPDLGVVNVYRPEEEVFNKDSLASFSHVPVTIDHPKEPVNANNWQDLAVGEASAEVLRDGQRLKIPLIVKSNKGVQAVKDGKRQLSAGYSAEIVWGDGVAPDGTPYQAKQTTIRANHIAIVQHGRAGSEFRIGDSADNWGARPFIKDKDSTMTTKTILVDGLSVEVTDAAEKAINKLQGQLADAAKKLSDADEANKARIDAKDADLAKKDAEIDALKGKILSDADLDKRVAARANLLSVASKLVSDGKFDGMTDAEIKRSVVVAKIGDSAKDKGEVYIEARFDMLVEDAEKTDDFRHTMMHRDTKQTVNDNGQAAYEERIRNAFKGA